jgi:multidrug efflux pump subunit AcrB
MWIVKAALKNPYAVAVLALMIVVLGTMSVLAIPKDILPVFKTPAVQVLTFYQGMPASSVEKTITNRIERWVNQAPGARLVESKSLPGVSVVKIYFRDDIDPNAALTLTTSLAQGTLPTLPPNTLPPVVLPFDPTGTLPLGILTVNNPTLDEAHIKDLGRIDVRNMLGSVPGTVAPVVVGGKDRTILIYLRPRDMWSRKVSPLDVVRAIQHGNLMVTPGTGYYGDNQVLLDTNAMVDKVEELNDFPIRMQPGDYVYLRDIGHAEDSYAIQTSRVRINGKSQVFVPIYRQGGASSLAVANGVKAKVPEIEQSVTKGTTLEFIMDQSVYVREAILSLIHEGVIGAVLVSIMILVFLGNLRMTFIASMSIPLAILCAVTGLYFTGNTINAMTLGGLALAIGPLVDDAIVVLENTHRHHTLGKSRYRAAFDGAVEVTIPVLVATTTTIIVLCPIAMMPGMGGFLFRPLTLAVAFAMISSFVLSRTFVPVLCARWLGGHTHPGAEHISPGLGQRLYGRIEASLMMLTRRYERLLKWALVRRGLVLTVVAVLFACSLGLFFGIGQEFFPQVDAGQITMYVRAPSYYNLDANTRKISRVEHFLNLFIPRQDRQLIVSELGLDPDWSAAYSANSGQQDTVIRIQLTDERTLTSQEYAIKIRHLFQEAGKNWQGFCRRQSPVVKLRLLQAFRKGKDDAAWAALRSNRRYGPLLQEPRFSNRLAGPEAATLLADNRFQALLHDRRFGRLLINPRFEDLNISFDTGGMVSAALNYGASSPIDIQIEGGSEQDAMALAKQIRGRVKDLRGAADVRILQRLNAPYLVLEVDRQKAAQVSLSASDVILQVVAAMNSSVSINRNFWIDAKTGNQYFVAVQYPEERGHSLEDLLNRVYATGPNQEQLVPLTSLLVHPLKRPLAAVEVNHLSLQRVFNVLVNTEHRDIGSLARDIKAELAQLQKQTDARVVRLEKQARMLRIKDDAGSRQRLRTLEKDIDRLKRLHPVLKGEYERMTESFTSLGGGLAMAAVLVYLLLVALFRSWLGPFIIMFTVPLGLIGVLTILYVTNTTLNVQSEMGVIFLVGIVVSNGVLLVDFANKQRKLGATVHTAITTAAAIRFRPILMTFLATFLDLIPMAIGMGKGSEANVPLARAVVGGLLTSTCLTLFVVPILYSWVNKDTNEPEIDIDKELADDVAPPLHAVPTLAGATPAIAAGGDGPLASS